MTRIFVFLLAALPLIVSAQNDTLIEAVTDSVITLEKEKDTLKYNPELKPGTFALRSALLPGWGQWSNRSYWKIPIAAGAVGVGIYGIVQTSNDYSKYLNASRNRLDTFKTDIFLGQLSTADLLQKTAAKKNRQTLSIFYTFYAYSMNILDAHTEAYIKRNPKSHYPIKAAFYSAMLPGLGQAYNRKYWKIPIVYAALGVGVGFVIYNERLYNDARISYITRTDNDPDSNYETSETIELTNDNLITVSEYYRRNRDLSYIITAGLYFLNIIDAIVDGHLYNFDVSDDLSRRRKKKDINLAVRPFMTWQQDWTNYKGLNFSLTF